VAADSANAHHPAERVRIAAELLPERIADDRHPRPGAEPFLFGGESTSVRRRRAEDLEVVRGHGGGQRAARPAADIQTDERRVGGREVGKDATRGFLHIAVVRVGERPAPARRRRAPAVHLPHVIDTFVQRPHQQAVDETEHAGVDAEAEGERDDGGQREPRTVAERPPREARVMHQVVEPPPSPGIARLFPQPQHVAGGRRPAHLGAMRLHLPAQFILPRAAPEQVAETTASRARAAALGINKVCLSYSRRGADCQAANGSRRMNEPATPR
jgi:hypothetical protein